MKSWLEIESRFRAMAAQMPHVRLDIQSGDAGEYFRLAGIAGGPEERELEGLFVMAGQLTGRAFDPDSEVLKESNLRLRWLRLVATRSGAFKGKLPGVMSDPASGTVLGNIFMGSVPSIAAESANLCLKLEASSPLRDPRTMWERVYEDFGREIIIGIIILVLSTIAAIYFKTG